MAFTAQDYQAAATRLGAPVAHIKAFADVESSGETAWSIDGVSLPPVRLEAHWFGKLTGYRFNATHPDISSTEWNPALAASTRDGAWSQVRAAEALDLAAADQATSWGAFQVMGFNYGRLGFATVADFVADMASSSGQMDAFERFVMSDPDLERAVRDGDWQTCETLYNGGGFNGEYAAKLEAAAARYDDNAVPRPLMLGDDGADVAALQTSLGILADGIFGAATLRAVMDFQQSHGLVADGIAGAMTRKALAQRNT